MAGALSCGAGRALPAEERDVGLFFRHHEVLYARLLTEAGPVCAEISVDPQRFATRLEGEDGALRASWRYSVGSGGIVLSAVGVVRFEGGEGLGSVRRCHTRLIVRGRTRHSLRVKTGTFYVDRQRCEEDPRQLELGACSLPGPEL